MEHVEGPPEATGGDVDRGRAVAVVVGVIAGAAIVAFFVQNTQSVHIEWLFFDFEWAVWFLVLVTIVLTLVGEELLQWTVRRRKAKAKRRADR
jgi:uncharacterized integral membrane protein